MSAQRPRQRLPISCEPCRVRKIRCTRDSPPCATCVRRRISPAQCVYSTTKQPRRSPHRAQPPSRPQQQSRQSTIDPAVSQPQHDRSSGEGSNADLVARIEKLEEILNGEAQLQDTGHSCSTVPRASESEDAPLRSEFPPAFATGTLIPSASGHVRFLPMTSSWRLVHRASQGACFPDRESAFSNTPSGPYPFGEHDIQSRSNLLALLPPREYCDKLKVVYFQSFAPVFPILHCPTFEKQYAGFSENPDQVSLAWLGLLFCVLGTAVLALEDDSHLLKALSRKDTPYGRLNEISERYYSAAMKCLEADRYLWRQNISTLQALLILIYGIQHSHGQTWTLLGLVYFLSLSIGCHVDPAMLSLDIVEAEERRRCWLALTTLLCNQNISITGFDIYPAVFSRVLPPAEVSDESIVSGQPAPIEGSLGLGSTPVSYLIRKSKLFRISSEISNPAFLAQPENLGVLHRLDSTIRAELNSLEQSYSSTPGVDPFVVHNNLLLSFTHHLILLLHSATLSELPSDSTTHGWSKKLCMESAQRVLELHADFHHLPQFTPFRWYIRGQGSFHAFHAAFVLMFILSLEPKESLSVNTVRLLHECHARLEASKTHSQLCTRTATILGQMLSSGLVENQRATPGGLDRGQRISPLQQDSSSSAMNTMGRRYDLDSLESNVFPSLFRQIEPQQWTNPINMDWEQWELITASLGTTS
ncbi:hypothetical protein BO82DRAFT_396671 [Aspergillus uvarum CBS 121591]|uniref:Zn(2)-C6 fungal-type domain-containing protein n=1 Tax=Aspergillus uvarum CBS 121591 TaxID=1448315 RepID=A0A319BQH8_9EURO|nr:hypothetical protein BO82DRAFT_396671 [Aspergillus uvarum CBS 121591]PYH75706.1 hypothetical protein BO82DRAFT_396671 [Aspergillus uvarum CBS 121591]